MTTKEPTAQEQAQSDQQKLMDFLAANDLTLDIFLQTNTGDVLTLRRALKQDYTGPDWLISVRALRKNGNGQGQ